MISLGIDPGTRRIGYGIVRTGVSAANMDGSNSVEFVDAGILSIESKDDPSALVETKRGMDALIEKYRPESIEKLFFAKNQKTALAVAQARGVILLAAREHGIRIREYAPNEVKLAITGYGFADKKAVLKMVRLTLRRNDIDVIDDASDALALAIIGGTDRG